MGISVLFDVDDGLGVAIDELRAAAVNALEADGRADAELTIRITGDALLQQLNRDHRGIDEPTDVLSFPASEDEFPDASEGASYLGDVAISIAAARRNAELTGTPLDRELLQLVTHGVLHLVGFDHETDEEAAAMRACEAALLGDWVHAIWDAPPTH